ncbi:MAG: NADH-ubiquinone oxidoreductase chain L (EC [uncultured Thiotrichaceae bacterium]|uniref:NADH-ubiquinone oxidoreductase chain L (EC) n=1 Tax=uncultured Thiotrichaceae bacterium TaxID=298394 RepID=A0A6S6TXI2_9GAMM|nr:MAG: NADH-ubiquinone oxidoreductase chain L (EC [uncultured Thiotrichaceae bacterium]
METVYLAIPLAPLFGAIIAGLFGKQIGRNLSHWVTTGSVALAFLLSLFVFKHITLDGGAVYNGAVYTWAVVDNVKMEIGFLIDNLTILMMLVVTFVSLMVHIYTIGYMHDDPGYQRFFSYISLFTFAMLMLVMSNNFLQLFFGWEAVGLVSYLLIGFWYEKDTAVYANMKAFIVNRIGDLGFLLGIAIILIYTSSLDYTVAFEKFEVHKMNLPGIFPLTVGPLTALDGVDALDLALVLLFIGAMGKSAQVPLHVWLPDSMEGPTPISALIHAATMVTAGIFMVARMSPLYELSDIALNVILTVGATTAFFMGLVGIVQNDIKRVIAYSTLSQLGYMTVALGASAYSAAVFHLMTHAFFKALLFLAAGSVIIAMHHEQDMRKMGGLRRYMPITYWTALIGSLALIGFPGFSGFFSKDLIIEAVHKSELVMADYAYVMVVLGVFVTAFYTFRMFFMVFHGDERMDDHTLAHLRESPKVVTTPLILLAIPSVLAGFLIDPVALGDFFNQVLLPVKEGFREVTTIMVDGSKHAAIPELRESYHGIPGFILHGFLSPAVWLAAAGAALAWYTYMKNDEVADWFYDHFGWLHKVLSEKYYLDAFNQKVLANGALYLGNSLWALGDKLLIDGLFVGGTVKVVKRGAALISRLQTGYLYHYAFSMVLGVTLMVAWILFVYSS